MVATERHRAAFIFEFVLNQVRVSVETVQSLKAWHREVSDNIGLY